MENKYKRIVRGAMLAVGMLVGGVSAWGQTITARYAPNYGRSTEVIYVSRNSTKAVSFQEGGAADNLDGFIRWYMKSGNNETTSHITVSGSDLQEYDNGYVWYNQSHTANSPGNACSVSINTNSYSFPSTPDTLIVEASSLWNVSFDRDGNITTPQITFQRKYVIINANEDEVSDLKDALDRQYRNWLSNSTTFQSLAALSDAERRNYFVESYELHTPLSQGNADLPAGTNYRISREVGNYYLGSNFADRVRWDVFNEKGTHLQTYSNISDNVWTHTFGSNEDVSLTNPQQYVLYLVASVYNHNNIDNYYPVSFIKVYLEPYEEPLTQQALDQYVNNSNYYERTEQYLTENHYKEVASVTFDNDIYTGNINNLPVNQNYSSTPIENATSYYAYAYPGLFYYRKDSRFSVGRGEYGLYRTLNYTDISEGTIWAQGDDGNNHQGMYNDYFAKDYTKDNPNNPSNWRYNKYIMDRLYDRTNHAQAGYFMYLDASDAPGTIANITLPSDLCPDTRLVVSAWICDMAFKAYNESDDNKVSNADVSFSFKGITSTGEEIILNRYQSDIPTTRRVICIVCFGSC